MYEESKKEKDNKKTEFKDLEQQYVVGDDNFWQVKPNVSFVELNTETGAVVNAQPKVSSWSYDIKVEKYDDATRFTDASKPITDQTSFKYSLYENYIKLAHELIHSYLIMHGIVYDTEKINYKIQKEMNIFHLF